MKHDGVLLPFRYLLSSLMDSAFSLDQRRRSDRSPVERLCETLALFEDGVEVKCPLY